MTDALASVSDVVTNALVAGEIPGAIVLVAHDSRVVHADARGVLDSGTGFALAVDNVLWLASLSKVVCAAAVMTLVDTGTIALADPVSRFIPEFSQPARVRVLAPGSPAPQPGRPGTPLQDPPPEWDIVPADRELNLKDLLTHTSGLQTIFLYNPDYHGPSPGDTLATHVPKLALVAREFQAGKAWAYSNAAAFDVLARVVEVASRQAYDDYLRTALIEPLGLGADLGFGRKGTHRAMPLPFDLLADPVISGDTYYSASAGMWGSPEAYLTFTEMLRRGGTHAGAELLSRHSVEQMMTNQVGELCPGLTGRAAAPGVGFGLGAAVLTGPMAAGSPLPLGTFGWDGVMSRRFWCCAEGGWSVVMLVEDQQVQQRIEAAVSETLA